MPARTQHLNNYPEVAQNLYLLVLKEVVGLGQHRLIARLDNLK